MYLDRVQKAMEGHYEVAEGAAALFQEAVRKLQDDYGNTGRLYREKFAEAKELYEATVAASREKGQAIVAEEFEKLHNTVREFITRPVPGDFISTLEAIRVTGKDITESEAEVYREKYKNNYTAYLSLSQCLQEQTGKRYYVARYDAIKKDIEEHKELATRFFNADANSYVMALLATPEKSPMMKFDAALQEFISGDVGSYESSDAIE